MSGLYTESEAETIRAFVRARKNRRQRDLAGRLAEARRDASAIVALIAREFGPARIYQWGSLVNDRHFSERSDIDLALEGITDPETLSSLRRTAERMTHFSLDIVAMEHMHPAYADFIRRRGRILYER